MCLFDHSRVVGLLAIFAYLIDVSKISSGAIPCSLRELNILRRFLNALAIGRLQKQLSCL